MPSLVFLTGFEHRVLSTAGGGLFASVVGPPTIETTIVRNGGASMKVAAAAANQYVQTPAWTANAKMVGRLAFRFDANPSSFVTLIESSAVGGAFWRVNLTTDGRLQANWSGGAPITTPLSNFTPTTGVWHVLDWRFDAAGTTGTIDWAIDGVAQTQGTATTAAGTFTYVVLGNFTSGGNGTFYLDDVAISTTTADYPIGDGKVIALVPGSDGAHNAAANQFDTGDTGGTNLTNATTIAYQMVDDAPPWSTVRSTTDNIRQDVAGTANYLEVAPAATPESGTANGVRATLAYSSPTATANEGGCVIRNSAGAEVTIWGSSAARADYSEITNFFKGAMPTKPVAGWTPSEVNALRWRVGYSNDISPVPTWQALMLEVDYPAASGPALVGSAALALSAAGLAVAPTALAGASALTVGAAGLAVAPTALAGAAALTLGAAGQVGVRQELVGAAALALAASGSVVAPTKLAGAAALALGAAGLAVAPTALAGSSGLVLASSGLVVAPTSLAGGTALTFTAAGLVVAPTALAGSSGLVLGASGVLQGLGLALVGSAAIVFTASGQVVAPTRLAGSSAVVVTASGLVVAPTKLAAAAALALGASGALGVAVRLAGSTGLVFSAGGTLVIVVVPGPGRVGFVVGGAQAGQATGTLAGRVASSRKGSVVG